MKYIYSSLFFLLAFTISAQNINLFDANEKRHGIWKKNFENTKILRYEGEFFHGKEIGVFKFYKNLKKKAVLTATKEFNKADNKAYVTFFTKRGKVISEGAMNGKNYIGEWKYYQKRSKELMTKEHYNISGELDGERIVYYANGEIAEKQFYIKGKLEGASVWYSINKVVLKEFIYVDGELHGISKNYNPKGELVSEGYYKNGKKQGIWKYYENNKLINEKNFSYVPKRKKK